MCLNQQNDSSGKEVARMSPNQNKAITKGKEVPRMSPNQHEDSENQGIAQGKDGKNVPSPKQRTT